MYKETKKTQVHSKSIYNQESFDQAITQYIIGDMQPISTVTSKYFKSLCTCKKISYYYIVSLILT